MSDTEQVDFAILFRAWAEEKGFINLLVIPYSNDTSFEILTLINEEGKNSIETKDIGIILTILRFVYNELAQEHGYMKSVDC